jgi:5'-nucleotidase
MKKRIMIDLDDVICNKGYLYLVNKFLNTNYEVDNFKNYYIQDVIPKERIEEWNDFFAKNNMYDKAEFIDTAQESIRKLSEKYEIFIVSAYFIKDNPIVSGKVLKDKFEWLSTNLPFISSLNFVFANNKEIIDCDIKIDDKLSNLDGHGEVKLLFDAYHNKNITDEELKSKNVQRVHNWKEIEDILL